MPTTYYQFPSNPTGYILNPERGFFSLVLHAGTANEQQYSLSALGFAVTAYQGSGMPPIDNQAEEFARADGSQFQYARATERVLALSGNLYGASLSDMERNRERLIAILKFDRTTEQQAVTLRYQVYEGDIAVGLALDIAVHYAGGLEGNIESLVDERLTLRLIAYQPYWTGAQETASLALQTTLSSTRIAQQAADGSWSAFPDPGAGIEVIFVGADGTVYIGGLNLASYWDGTAWVALPGLTGTVHAFAEVDGVLFAGGEFTGAGGIVNVASWDGAAWNENGDPGLTAVYTMIVPSLATGTGWLIVAGTSISSLQQVRYAGSLPAAGATWDDWGAIIAIAPVNDLLMVTTAQLDGASSDETRGTILYAATSNALMLCVDGGAWAFLHAASGGYPDYYSLVADPDATLWASRADAPVLASWDDISLRFIATAEKSGISAPTLALRASDKSLFCADQGLSPNAIGVVRFVGRLTRYVSNAWLNVGIGVGGIPSDTNLTALAVNGDAVIVGWDSAAVPYVTAETVLTNTGTASAYPVITVTEGGTEPIVVYHILNLTTGDFLELNAVLRTGETLTIDLRPGRKTIAASQQRNILRSVSPASNLATWRLLPGENRIGLLVSAFDNTTPTDTTATIVWDTQYWGVA